MTISLSLLKRSGASVLAVLALLIVLAVSASPPIWQKGGEVPRR